jgi:hypothetical protein
MPPACPAAAGGVTRTRPGGRKTTVESEIISGIQRTELKAIHAYKYLLVPWAPNMDFL